MSCGSVILLLGPGPVEVLPIPQCLVHGHSLLIPLLLLLLLSRFRRPSTLRQLLYHKERERDLYFIVTQCDRLSLI